MPAAAHILPPPLRDGDRLTRDEFMRRWEAMPDLKFAELLDGVVSLRPWLTYTQSTLKARMIGWTINYADATAGSEGGCNATWLMSKDCVPQPDISLRVREGGSSFIEGEYLAGSPELALEILGSNDSGNLAIKSDIYCRHGVGEYLAILTHENDVLWRSLVHGEYRTIAPDSEGVLRSSVFPGLWLNTAALWKEDWAQLRATHEAGLATPEHAEFVRRLSGSRK